MGSSYEIDIALSPDTVADLKNSGFALYAFKAVKSAVAGGAPLVWFSTTSILTKTQVTWEEQYQAYISTSQIVANGQVNASTSCDVNLGQVASVDANGNMVAKSGGTASAISIMNNSSSRWTTGISQVAGGNPNPMCAIPLFGNNLDVVVPIEKVLLMFASNTVNTGTVIYKAYSPGLLIDLTASQTRAVSFDIDDGWDAAGGTWAQPVSANDNLVPLLITSM